MKVTIKRVDTERNGPWDKPESVGTTVRRAFVTEGKRLVGACAEKVRYRVQAFGLGADSTPVKDYSTRRLSVEQYSGLKPKKRPRGAEATAKLDNRNNWIGTYAGGYKEYRQKTGLVTIGFHFSNMGTAWRHFGATEPVRISRRGAGFIWSVGIGFKRLEDRIAADAADQERPNLFKLGHAEARELLDGIFMEVFNEGIRNAFRK